MSAWKHAGEFLGLSFAASNPPKLIKQSKRNLGKLPLEIITYVSAYTNSLVKNKTLDAGVPQAMILGDLISLNEVLAGTERVLNTPLPVAYSIAISQITWVYVIMLPFQLWKTLGWTTIPGTIVGAYIILGIAAIGREIENPFGHDVNDLPLEKFCKGSDERGEYHCGEAAADARGVYHEGGECAVAFEELQCVEGEEYGIDPGGVSGESEKSGGGGC